MKARKRKTMRRYPRKIMRRAASDVRKGLVDTGREAAIRPSAGKAK